jgi:hypothetical protein
MDLDDQISIFVVLEEKTECTALLLHSHVVATMLSCVVNRQNIKPEEGATILNAVAPMGVKHKTELHSLVQDFPKFHNCKFRSASFENFNGAWEILTITFLSLDNGKEFQVALPRHNVMELFTALCRGVGYANGDINHPLAKKFLPKENSTT